MELATIGTPALWVGFTLCVLALLALDLGVFHRKAHQVGLREAAAWSVVWVTLALAFNGLVLPKMLLIDVYEIPIGASLGVIASLIALGVAGSLRFPKREAPAAAARAPGA